MPSALKAALREGRPQLGTFAKFSDPSSVEILGLAGFDFIIIDREHTQLGSDDMVNLIRAAERRRITPIVRVRSLDAADILHALDAGALGVQIPQVNTAAYARAAVDAVKYPPLGRRGFAATQRSADYGFSNPAAYAAASDEDTLLVCYCETKEAVENLDAILATPGIDVVFLGPADLSASYGCIGRVNEPVVQNAIETALQKIRASGKAAGTVCRDASGARALASRGFTYISLDSDQGILGREATRHVADFRAS